jgi:nucleoside-diphosphate-sugar epimerase
VYDRLLGQNYSNIYIPRKVDYDLRNASKCKDLFDAVKPDIVIHLAATCGGIGANSRSPGQYFYDNVSMGLNIIEQSRLYNIRKFVLVGTVCAYPKFCNIPFQEKDIWNGYPEETNAPYGIAKKSLFVMLDAYEREYGLNSTILVPSNLYGPYDNFEDYSSHVIPALIKKIDYANKTGQETVTIWGDGSPSREFLYVDQAAQAIVKSININTGSSPINIGSGEEIRITDLVNKLIEKMNFTGFIKWDESKPNGQPRRCVSTKKAMSYLGWQNKIDMDTGLDMTLEWYNNA